VNALLVLLSLVSIVAVFLLVRIAGDVRRLRDQSLPDLQNAISRGLNSSGSRQLLVYPTEGVHEEPPHGPRVARTGYFLIWEWQLGEWVPRDVQLGVRLGLPPAYPGAFEGDIAKTWVPVPR